MITRIAPTPSGYLHEGNAAHIVLVDSIARELGAVVALRIDQADTGRTRDEYLEDVFGILAWLGIDWEVGPRNPAEARATWSQAMAADRYRAALTSAVHAGLPVYACRCSRREMAGPATGGCPGDCRGKGFELAPGVSSLRVRVPLGTRIQVDAQSVDIAAAMGDFVIWRRDDLPAYQLASVVDDVALGTDLLIRGADLLASTAAQFYLAPYLNAQELLGARVVHHRLLVDESGSKLSKSAGHGSQPLPRDDATLTRVRDQSRALVAELGLGTG